MIAWHSGSNHQRDIHPSLLLTCGHVAVCMPQPSFFIEHDERACDSISMNFSQSDLNTYPIVHSQHDVRRILQLVSAVALAAPTLHWLCRHSCLNTTKLDIERCLKMCENYLSICCSGCLITSYPFAIIISIYRYEILYYTVHNFNFHSV